MTKKRVIITGLIFGALIAGAAVYFVLFNNDDNGDSAVITIEESSPSQTVENDTESADPTESQDSTTNNTSETQTEEAKPEKTKTTALPSSVKSVEDPPLVYTGYGHSQTDPLKLNQETSTTCTTEAGVSCLIEFKSTSGKTVRLAAKTTDAQGIALWNWKGSQLGAGTWKVYAVAGNKTSEAETIYIK